MKDSGEKLENKWAIESSDLKDTIKQIPQPRQLYIEYRDEEFKDKFHLVINIENQKDTENKRVTMMKT